MEEQPVNEQPTQPEPAPQPAPPPAPEPKPAPKPGPSGTAARPGMVQALGIATLVSGILNILLGFGLMFTVVWILPAAYGIVVGILEIIYATKIMAEPMKTRKVNKPLAIMEIIAIVNGSVVSLGVGIFALVAYNNPEVLSYFAAQPEQS